MMKASMSLNTDSLWGLTPELRYIFTKKWSNIDTFSYKRHQFMFGLSREF